MPIHTEHDDQAETDEMKTAQNDIHVKHLFIQKDKVGKPLAKKRKDGSIIKKKRRRRRAHC